MEVHVAPLLQHPPPAFAGQPYWPVGQFEDSRVGLVVLGPTVDTQTLLPQTEPTEQQLPPRDFGHWKATPTEQGLGQHFNRINLY